MADFPVGGGAVSECQRREDRGNEGQGRRGCPLPLGKGLRRGLYPPPQKIFEFLK